MASNKGESGDKTDEDDLDPRIQIELEKLNNATDDINKLEIELDEAISTFRILMNDSKRRLNIWSRRLGSCKDRARPYYEALEIAKKAQMECQRAAVKFQRANEIHQAAKETVALAEARYLSQQHVWPFDTTWQEMLNHTTKKVTEAENQKAESGREHQRRATLFNAAEQKVQMLEQRLKRHIVKSRPYFDEKAICESQLEAQKQRVEELQSSISKAKAQYSASLRQLEAISEEIHLRRKDKSGNISPRGPREPGVGAELNATLPVEVPRTKDVKEEDGACGDTASVGKVKIDLDYELEHYDVHSLGSVSRATSSAQSDAEELDDEPLEENLDELRAHVKELSQRSEEAQNSAWESELSATIHRLDNALHMRECEEELRGESTLRSESPSTRFTIQSTINPNDKGSKNGADLL